MLQMLQMLQISQLHNYQLRAIDHIMNVSHCGLFLEMGLGKTVSTLTAIDKLMFEELAINTVLIIAPKRVVESVWLQETQNWSHLNHLKVVRVIGTERQRRQALCADAHIYCISRDNISWLCAQYGGQNLPFDMLVIDELSSFKNPKSLRFKSLKQVQPSFDRVIGLTGTPSPNGLMDLWSQVYLLDRGKRLGKFITHYRDAFFKPDKRNGAIVYSYKPKQTSEDLIKERIKDICISMTAKEYLDLPDVTINDVDILFTDKLTKAYKDFEREKVLELFSDNGEITAANAAALSNKLLQFSNGAVYDDEKNTVDVHKLKIEAAKEIVEAQNGKPILIAYNYKHDLERLLVALKEYTPVKMKSDEDVRAWNRGEIQVMLMHPASGGHGLNIQKGGSTILWFGLNWSLELYQQFNARLYRQGQKDKVIIHRLVSKGTIDEDVVRALSSKAKTQDGLMEAVKARISNYLNPK